MSVLQFCHAMCFALLRKLRQYRWVTELTLSLCCIVGMIAAAYFVKTAYVTVPRPMTFRLMSDFDMRYNEATCVREGTNPFDVWRGVVVDSRFEPWSFAKMRSDGVDFSRFVHAYPPWEYTCLLPFVGFERRMAEYVFIGLMFGGLVLLSVGWFCVGCCSTLKIGRGLLLVTFCWSQASPITACLVYGNFGIWIAASVALALYCHVRKWDGWAGVFWALAMVKPQIAAIFFVPLLLLRKWRTLLSLGLLLSVATLIPSVLCRCSPIDMVLCISEYSAGQFTRTGFIGRPIFLSLVMDGGVSPSLLTGTSAFVGCLICTVCTVLIRKLRTNDEVFETLAAFVPALVLSTVWTASRIHDFCIHSVTVPLLVLLALRTRDWMLCGLAWLLALGTALLFLDQYQSGRVNVMSMLSVLLLVCFSYRTSGRVEMA